MKTAISIPDPLFEAAEQFAKRMGLSRSELYAVALQEYLQTHKREQVTKQLDAVYADEDSSLDPFFVQLQADTLSEETW
ncbi:MAG: CopG family ribbon-helix-helix protein [Nostoc sp. ChiSLP01]|jgi:metal-responsive CopG/Arc/MetJ family transcriptional regulator|uniref:CopG family ribbon-helix-helix protein n=1 Tax=Nostoc sp. DSM 114161 TaxID=3440143 RepID=UPI002ADCD43F|nr:ChpI protein [Nostoc sp. CmiSLP01]MDZ8285132.1 ChpI protein [Nostoc sp. ChiSLP01]